MNSVQGMREPEWRHWTGGRKLPKRMRNRREEEMMPQEPREEKAGMETGSSEDRERAGEQFAKRGMSQR